MARNLFKSGVFDFVLLETEFRSCRLSTGCCKVIPGESYASFWRREDRVVLPLAELEASPELRLHASPAAKLETLCSWGSPVFLVRSHAKELTLVGHPEAPPQRVTAELAQFLRSLYFVDMPKAPRTSGGGRPRIEDKYPHFAPTMAKFIEDNLVLQEKSLSRDLAYTRTVTLKDFTQHMKTEAGIIVSQNTIAHKFLPP